MRIETIDLFDWRNLEKVSLQTPNQFVIFHGQNGAGKTNILEAIYMFSTLRSFRETMPQNMIRKGCVSSRIQARVRSAYGVRKMEWIYSVRGRQLLIDGAKLTNLSSWFTPIRVILFSPSHLKIVNGGPSERRRFLDRARFTASPAYLELVREYTRIVAQKKALLNAEKIDSVGLAVWNEKLVNAGIKIVLQRQLILEELLGPFQDIHNYISGSKDISLSLTGISGKKAEEVRDFFYDTLERKKNDEIKYRRCLCGPHLDDMNITINGLSAKKFASQGQARTIVIALKFAELEAARKRGESPLFLLDDLSSELDRDRTRKLVQLLMEKDNQIWITTTEPTHLGSLPKSAVSLWNVKSGKVIKKN